MGTDSAVLTEAMVVQPLDVLRLPGDTAPGAKRFRVTDARGRPYVDEPTDRAKTFRVAGALGWQRAAWVDAAGQTVADIDFRVECRTRIDDGEAGFGDLLDDLHFTMLSSAGDQAKVGGKIYRYFIRWLRDHTHTLKGMKYFSDELKSALELYADAQRDDGMLYERIAAKDDVQDWRDYTFRKGDFIRTLNPGTENCYSLQRIPVENDVEFLFLECLYRTWEATGDDAWMARHLDHAIRAVRYATTDRYRWSEKFRLLKRGYTIDTWDFMHADDSALTLGDNVCDIDKTTFGVMHGDNTGMAAGCRMLAAMLRAADRADEATTYDKLADELLGRLEQVAWDDRGYYRHHVSEDPSFVRDVGETDEAAQVSLSNAYALNRDIGDDKCRAIIATYQRIAEQMPEASPGEWYNIYPPFERGFGKQDAMWQYMNGGVSTIVAGELARGAFAHGDDDYGVDILRRVKALADRHGGRLHVCFNGNPQTDPPDRSFTPIDLSPIANVTAAHRAVGGWGDPDNDLSRMPTGRVEYHHVPFEVDPDGKGLGIAHDRPGFGRELRVPVGGRHAAMYLLHTASQPQSPTAELDVVYADGQTRRVYLAPGKQFDSWFMPGAGQSHGANHASRLPRGWPAYQIAWRGGNATFENVGTFIWGWDSPRPNVEIAELVFRAAANASVYFVPGITFSDHPVWFPQRDLSFGIPDAWGAAAVVYALIEGLAGVVDASTMFQSVQLTPRWAVAGIDRLEAAVTYPASGGYVAYQYHHDAEARTITLTIAAAGERVELHPALPSGSTIDSITIDGKTSADDDAERIVLQGPGPHEVRIAYR